MKKITKKELKKLYISHNETSAPDMDRLWEKIESGLEEKPESGVSSKPVRSFNLRWAAAVAAVLIIVPSVIIGTDNIKTDMSLNEAAAPQAADEAFYVTTAADRILTEETANGANVESEEVDEAGSTPNALPQRIDYGDLDLAPTDGALPEMPYGETVGDDFFVEERVLAETDIIVDAVVERVYSSGGGTVCYVLTAEDCDKNDMGEITVESATAYLLQANREYILPLKETAEGYRLAFENAPQIEVTRDGGAVFHNGWQCLSENSVEVVYPQGGIDDFFYDRMRFTAEGGMEKVTKKWYELKESED